MPTLLSPATFLSIAAGFAGGLAAQALCSPQSLMAQLVVPPEPPNRPHKRPAATEVDAQRFVLVDPAGKVNGEIRMNDDEPEIILYGKDGHIAWKATTHQRGYQLLDNTH